MRVVDVRLENECMQQCLDRRRGIDGSIWQRAR